jgi:endogenous inhibitor of DNA gyrase (YacG/DUF329 family)
VNGKARDQRQTPCPHCGADADWSYFDAEKSQVDVECPDCGRFQMSREEFDQAISEVAGVEDSERVG